MFQAASFHLKLINESASFMLREREKKCENAAQKEKLVSHLL